MRTDSIRSVSRLAAALAGTLLAGLAPSSSRAQGTVPTDFVDQLVLGGFTLPVGMAKLPDGRVFVIEQKSAKIRLIVSGAIAATDPVCTVDAVKTAGGEQGLLGIAVDPGWPANPYVYVHCDNLGTTTIRISRYTVTGDLSFTGNGSLSIDVASRFDLITTLPDVAPNHNGGTLRFGPDGKLYDSMGEDAQSCLAQDDATFHGVILRLEVSGLPSTPGGPPSIDVITPADNPQIGSGNANTRLIWAWGLRNPFRFQIDPTNGTLFIGDVGENQFEEIDRAPAGGLNFGWPIYEGNALRSPGCSLNGTATAPIATYDRTQFASGSAAVMCAGAYRAPGGASSPFPAAYNGNVFFSDYYEGFLRRLTGSGSNWSLGGAVPGQPNATDWGSGFDGVSDYMAAADGSLWYCSEFGGQIRRIVYQPGNPPPPPPPPASGPAVTLGLPFPQPGEGSISLPYSVGFDGTLDLGIFDLNGRQVRHLIRGTWQTAGTSAIAVWDGRDDDGHPVRPGVYLVHGSAGGGERSRTLLLLR